MYTDLTELKAVLEIDPSDALEDKKLLIFARQASEWIEEILNRQISFKSRTITVDGTGTQKLLLPHRPVYPNPGAPYLPIQVKYDVQGLYGQSPGAFADVTTLPLTYGSDYTLRIDQDNGSSRSGILYRIGDLWMKPIVRQAGWLSSFVGPDTGSYQIQYTAGHTVDTLPETFRWACNLLVAKMRALMPTGAEANSESYEERSVATVAERKDYLTSLVRGAIGQYRNWKF